ncbi:cold-shock protein [Sphaerisporangium dianthi]|uniref:Cold-shock protein n=1 Tax=Sphaerisporangium dianthi TaxID=1436120 RepID=A0ABV9CCF0_9ACTN
MAVGTILRFDEVRGYGFIAPSAGGEDVFFHANDFGENRHQLQAGLRVSYEVAEGDRGLKVAAVRILEPARHSGAPARVHEQRAAHHTAPQASSAASVPASGDFEDDEGLCDVLAAEDLSSEVTELLVTKVPTLTGAQITQIRQHLLQLARSHGWVDA